MKREEKAKKMRKTRRIIIILIIVLAAAACAATAGYQYMKGKMNKIKTTELDKTKVKKNDVSEETKKVFAGNTTIALFGLDNRQTGNYSRGNSDVIMLLNINNDTKKIQAVSVYRDTYLNIQGDQNTFHKANAAYAYGGAEQAISMLNKSLDIDIDNYVTFDFKTVADAIDVLGGVDINIESQEELGYLNMYIDHTNGILKTSAKHVTSTGKQTLSGVQAVAYGRIRYTSGSDFKRAERHRIVLNQLLKKAKKANITELNKIMDVVFPQIETDLSKSKILEMVEVMVGYDLKDSRGFPFEKASINMHGNTGWVDVPCDLETNVKELHEYLYGTKDYEPTEEIKSYTQTIIANTGLSAQSAEKDKYEDVDDFDSDSSDKSTTSSENSSDKSTTSDNSSSSTN